MHSVMPQRLDLLTLPLQGVRLIEASAGTGKTFTISKLCLRLILGLGEENAFSRPLSVDEILVVTFTEAATEELRNRIRSDVHQLRLACLRGGSDDPVMQSLLAEISDTEAAATALLAAERQMDEAAVFTIHSFCQRMLNLNAFESGMLFEQRLIENEHTLYQQAAADFWRRCCYPLPLDVARAVASEWRGPEQLLGTLLPWLQGEPPTLKHAPDEQETLIDRHEKIIARIEHLKKQWQAAAADLPALFADSGIDRRSYNSKNLPAWLEKISNWAAEKTQSYLLPAELSRFTQRVLLEKTRKGEPPRHVVFNEVEKLLAEPLTLRNWVIARALREIRHTVKQEKLTRALLGFDDLLSRLDEALVQPGGEALTETIRNRYPVALIDEFQDTDPQQYRIFHRLYIRSPGSALLLIGDPKQAIYAFRGADIFTYMHARAEVSAHYTLATNWRSSPAMVDAVNRLFSRLDNPFLFQEIPFVAVRHAPFNETRSFRLNNRPQPALRFWLQPAEGGVSVSEYQCWIARQCAAEISGWLQAGQQGEALIGREDNLRPVRAADITVLVRSRGEAAAVRDALNKLNIPSVYLSGRDSVFAAPEARELLWLLQAILMPEQEHRLRSALATGILGLDAAAIDALSQDERAWDALINEFTGWRQRWHQRGVLPMLYALMAQRQIAENLLASEDGERRLTDLLHLGELLQEAGLRLDSQHALVRWLASQIAQPDWQAASQQLRLESDRHLVQIVTIHKAKGREYPLVWLPFAVNFRQAASSLYHDRETFRTLLDLHNAEESWQLAEQERLAEDLRLLYVALTRSVYHCSVGVAPLFKGGRRKTGNSDVHKSALGYLLQKGEALDAAGLSASLQALCTENIDLIAAGEPAAAYWQSDKEAMPELHCLTLSRRLQDNWRVTSYSGLLQHGSKTLPLLPDHIDSDTIGEKSAPVSAPAQLTPHTFPRGAVAGTFLHGLFEQLDFAQPLQTSWLEQQLQRAGFAAEWLPVLKDWIESLVSTPLNQEGVTLQQLEPASKRVEMEFYLPINNMLTAASLDAVIRRFDPLSAQAPALDFQQVQGMLKGFIDLVFCWRGKYYLLDYKSNWLGGESEAYTPQAMARSMIEHRYDLQYQLYTLALHRYLRHRIGNYDYERHFGGVFYLFLRGMDGSVSDNGIFYVRPPETLITTLDRLFAGNKAETE